MTRIGFSLVKMYPGQRSLHTPYALKQPAGGSAQNALKQALADSARRHLQCSRPMSWMLRTLAGAISSTPLTVTEWITASISRRQ